MLVSAFILGLLGSFHCIGMCGPIAFMLPVDQTNAYKKVLQISAYHIGRLITYSIILCFLYVCHIIKIGTIFQHIYKKKYNDYDGFGM